MAMTFRDGDADAVRDVYRRYSGRLFAVSRSMLGAGEDARDAVQQTLIQAWRASARYDPERPLAAWLYQICRRVCIDRLRAQRRSKDFVTDYGSVTELPTFSRSMEQTWTVWQVRAAIDDLAPEWREIVGLYHLEGWSLPEIADHLGLPLGTVKSRS